MNREQAIKQIEKDLAKAIYNLKAIYPDFDPTDIHNVDTPKRIAKLWTEMCEGYNPMNFEFTTFPVEEETRNWIIKKDIEFSSFCQHHFLPFSGKVHIGYVPDGVICGISKLDRVVDYFSKKPQVQENFGDDILDFLDRKLSPRKLAVIVESLHTCVACRGIKSRNSTMLTTHTYNLNDVLLLKELIR